jgi:hypothetical protein
MGTYASLFGIGLLLSVLCGPAVGQAFVEGGGPHPSPLLPDRAAYHAFYSSFVPQSCCYTSHCCWEISERDVVDLGNDQFQIKASGQVVERKGDSPDGGWHRCACDYQANADSFSGRWKISPQANTRCLFTPHRGS